MTNTIYFHNTIRDDVSTTTEEEETPPTSNRYTHQQDYNSGNDHKEPSSLMADTVAQVLVSPFVGALSENLISLIQKEVGLIWGVEEEVNKLSSTLSTIQDVLEDAEAKQLTEKAITNWLRKVKDAAYDADDVLDDWVTKDMRPNQLLQIKFRWKIAKKINALRKRFDEIAAERLKFHLNGQVAGQRIEFNQNRETSSILTEPEVYGRDEDEERIVQLLFNRQEYVSILGMGGLGKTTLAQLIYKEDTVKSRSNQVYHNAFTSCFQLQQIKFRRKIKALRERFDEIAAERLKFHLREQAVGQRVEFSQIRETSSILTDPEVYERDEDKESIVQLFLLVLDDVWNENQEEWNKFKYSLGCGVKREFNNCDYSPRDSSFNHKLVSSHLLEISIR